MSYVRGSFLTGFCRGLLPNNVHMYYNKRRIALFPIPIMTGLACSMITICSPLLLINYFSEGTYFDKLFDKYEIDVKRYLQYDGNNNKYGFPSLIIINVDKRKEGKGEA